MKTILLLIAGEDPIQALTLTGGVGEEPLRVLGVSSSPDTFDAMKTQFNLMSTNAGLVDSGAATLLLRTYLCDGAPEIGDVVTPTGQLFSVSP